MFGERMTWDSKVAWSQGMFLQAQHFQQSDRYVEQLVRGSVSGLRPYGWGIRELRIDEDLLTTGKFALSACRGVLEDGTPFDIPRDANHPPPLELPESVKDCIVYLILPLRQQGGAQFDPEERGDAIARYGVEDYEAGDSNLGADSEAGLRVGKLRFRFALETDERAGYACLGLARVVEVWADKSVVLDPHYIPPCLDCGASPVLSGFLNELQGLVHHRGEALAHRVSEPDTKGVAEIADFLLLQAVNRSQPLLSHLATAESVHPEAFFSIALGIAGELATFTVTTRRPPSFPVYRHEDLQRTFAPLMVSLRQTFTAVIEQTAIPIPLQERKYGIRVASLTEHRPLLTQARFVLAVKADMPGENLRRNFPNHVKIGSVESIRELVNSAVQGIRANPLTVTPRQIPYHGGTVVFELERSGPHWKSLESSGGIAIHLAGHFPGVEMALWAIKEG